MEKKEAYKNILPHFQQSGQAYFVTWVLRDAIPRKALYRYTQKLDLLKSQMEPYKNQNPKNEIFDELKLQYNLTRKKYIKAYDDLLAISENTTIDLSKPENLKILLGAIYYWEGKKVKSYACCIMPNHIHWIFEVLKNDEEGNSIYLQDILQSVKRHSAREINKGEGRTGSLWQKESFDTTIRDEKHLHYAVEYTLNNPVAARLTTNWENWPGNILFGNY